MGGSMLSPVATFSILECVLSAIVLSTEAYLSLLAIKPVYLLNRRISLPLPSSFCCMGYVGQRDLSSTSSVNVYANRYSCPAHSGDAALLYSSGTGKSCFKMHLSLTGKDAVKSAVERILQQ